jgi:uncharacterized protein
VHIATARGTPQIVYLLISHGADVYARTTDGTTPLIHAINNGACSHSRTSVQEIVRILLAAGADPNATDIHGRTILHRVTAYAMEGWHYGPLLAAARIAMEHGADPAIRDGEGRTAGDITRGGDKAIAAVFGDARGAGGAVD